MSNKPKIDYSKLEEYSRASQQSTPIKAPPVHLSTNAHIDNSFILDVPSREPKRRANSKPLSDFSTRQLVVGTLIANAVVLVVVLVVAFWPKPNPLQQVAKAIQASSDLESKRAESCKLESIEYRNAFTQNHRINDTFMYRFKITFKNIGHETLTHFPLKLQAIRNGRPAADYTTSLFCEVKGGCKPGETLSIVEDVWCSALRGPNIMQGFNLDNGATIQASVNGKRWISAQTSNDAKLDDGPDPLMQSLFNAKVP